MNIVSKILSIAINNKSFRHIKKFGVVGCLNTIIDFGLFSLLNSVFGINYAVSQIMSYSAGTLNSYLFNKYWTFTDTRTQKKTTREIVQFIVVNTASLTVSIIGLSILLKDPSMNSLTAKLLTMGLAQVVNFLGYRFWVFGNLVKQMFPTRKAA